MFKRDHHLRIATVLQSLNAEVLRQKNCYFGGGTAIVLLQGEYRESIDIDFLVSNQESYRDLRNKIKEQDSLNPILKENSHLDLITDIRVDQYGIRTMLKVGNAEIKFEIVYEGRIEFEAPSDGDKICGVTTLSPLDMATSKLLANSDRWNDSSVFHRDIIDLAMLDSDNSLLAKATEKASTAYGDSIGKDLQKAYDNLKKNPTELDRSMEVLKMDSTPKALLWEKIRQLIKKSGLHT